jgi:hypothetical protein
VATKQGELGVVEGPMKIGNELGWKMSDLLSWGTIERLAGFGLDFPNACALG